jgi:hypothetical protein
VRQIVHLVARTNRYAPERQDANVFLAIVARELPATSLQNNPPQNRRRVVKVMVFVKATQDSENEAPPTQELLNAMHQYNEALIAAGILKEQILGGLKPTRYAKRVHFSGKSRTVIDGPFTETKEAVAGFWLWDVKSIEEAVEWVKKCPNPMFTDSDIDIRPLFSMDEMEDWGNPK